MQVAVASIALAVACGKAKELPPPPSSDRARYGVDGPWNDTAPPSARVAVDAYDHIELSLRYFRDRFCRNSFDGVGTDVRVVVDKSGYWDHGASSIVLGLGYVDENTGS